MIHAFKCGTPVLDFVGTLRARRNAEPLEMLASPESLDAWFSESGIVDGDTHCEPSDVAEAVALREAIYTLVAARLVDESYDPDALALVNRKARKPSAVPQLTWEGRRIEATPQQAVSSIARQAIRVLSGPEVLLIKECTRPECTQIYIDRSHGNRREWCAMDPCGNRVKAAAYRARKKANKSRPSTAAVGQ
ncbi:CGNR zinc finger domain-containing protein [Streptomyces sp. NPDC005077]|uniref:CGNR zinc finger domain-containing protein n=1 Tax=Streptomyces sp. NPDC005077 TaxID=3154292 RepID=UPI0033B677B3